MFYFAPADNHLYSLSIPAAYYCCSYYYYYMTFPEMADQKQVWMVHTAAVQMDSYYYYTHHYSCYCCHYCSCCCNCYCIGCHVWVDICYPVWIDNCYFCWSLGCNYSLAGCSCPCYLDYHNFDYYCYCYCYCYNCCCCRLHYCCSCYHQNCYHYCFVFDTNCHCYYQYCLHNFLHNFHYYYHHNCHHSYCQHYQNCNLLSPAADTHHYCCYCNSDYCSHHDPNPALLGYSYYILDYCCCCYCLNFGSFGIGSGLYCWSIVASLIFILYCTLQLADSLQYSISNYQPIGQIAKSKKMISFGQTKNSLQKLKSYLKKMQYFENTPNRISLKDLDEQTLRLHHNELFLPLINFLLIDYNSDIYIQILNRLPNIKYKDDRKFVEDVLNISREMFRCNVALTAQQFLTGKYFEKKLEFVGNLAKAVYERVEGLKKGRGAKEREIYQMGTNVDQYQFNNELDDFQDEVPMTITAVPMKFDPDELNKKQQPQQGKGFVAPKTQLKNKFIVNGQQFDEQEVQRALEERHPTPIQSIRRPMDEPTQLIDKTKPSKSNKAQRSQLVYIQQKNFHEDDDQDTRYERFKLEESKNKVKTHKPTPHHKTHEHHQHRKNNASQHSEQVQYVSIQKFNELVGLLKVVSETVDQISQKFVALQSHISSEVGSMNARILMLENSVRLLKDNL